MYEYNGIIFNNANPKHADGTKAWSQMCRICAGKYKIKRTMLENVWSGTCGVQGCTRQASFYINFEDGELVEVVDWF